MWWVWALVGWFTFLVGFVVGAWWAGGRREQLDAWDAALRQREGDTAEYRADVARIWRND